MLNHSILCKKLGELCLQKQIHIALAESCTGGLVAANITDIAGSSQWFLGGAVVYSNAAKINLLGVDTKIIEQFGAVSPETAIAMAQGALQKFQSDIALSITGIAGPDGGTKDKPVGTVCFALSDTNGVKSKIHYFTGDRASIREQACEFALEWMCNHLTSVKV